MLTEQDFRELDAALHTLKVAHEVMASLRQNHIGYPEALDCSHASARAIMRILEKAGKRE